MMVPTPPEALPPPHRACRPLYFQDRRLLRHAGVCLAVAIHPSLDTLKTLSVILLLILASRSLVWSGSQYIFPRLDEKDLPFYLDKQEQTAAATLYLYSSLSLLSLDKALIVFNISHYPFKYIAPLAAIDVYPDSDILIQSEFFDFTIWGQLGNFFNKTIEIMKIEREILEILKKIEEVNRKYKEFLESNLIPKIDVDKIITIDKMNFFDFSNKNDQEKLDMKKHKSTRSESKGEKADPNSMIEMYESEFRRERLRGDIHFQTVQGGIAGPGFYDAAYVRSVNTSQKLDAEKPEIDSFLFRIFYKMVTLIKYFQSNIIESLIYLSLLLLLTTFIKVLFTR